MTETPRPSFSLRDILAQIRRRFPWPGKPPVLDPHPEDDNAERVRVQVAVVRKYLDGEVAAASVDGPRRARDDADTKYLYRPSHVLVRDGDDFALLERFFREPERRRRFRGELERADLPTMPGLVVARMPSRTDSEDDVLMTLEELDEVHRDRAERQDPVATPDHILYVTGPPRLCPFTEPEEPPSADPVPPVAANSEAGADVRVAVVDTGWWKKAGKTIGWLGGVTADPADEEQVDENKIHEYAGHGTFIAGVVRCLAPKARVELEGFAPKGGGAVYESHICQQLSEALLDNDMPQIISVSAGTHTRNSWPLIAFQLLALAKGILDPKNKVLVVAAAGNEGSTEKFYPAAFDWVVGVGSVGANGKISEFSNTSDPKGDDWVNVYARGENLVNAFPEGRYVCYEPENIHNGIPDERHFRGMAQWSGTSFSTPIVSGAIAAKMSELRTDDPRVAYDALMMAAQPSTSSKVGAYRIIGPL